jgi:hypothetical protein
MALVAKITDEYILDLDVLHSCNTADLKYYVLQVSQGELSSWHPRANYFMILQVLLSYRHVEFLAGVYHN